MEIYAHIRSKMDGKIYASILVISREFYRRSQPAQCLDFKMPMFVILCLF